MRILTVFTFVSLLCLGSAAALADPQSYCELYSKDFADGRTANVDKWQLLYRSAFNDCMVRYDAKPAAETVVAPAPAAEEAAPVATGAEPAAAPEAKPAEKPKARKVASRKTVSRVAARNLVPGSDAWNAFCTAKYTSFNKLNGTYLSNSGKIRRCSTSR